jgi:hypothetical protein
VLSSDLPGVNPATLNEILLYYRLMTKYSGLGDSTELSRVGLSQFLREKGQILWDVTVDTAYVHLMNFLAPGLRDMFDANNKAVDYLFRAMCQSEFDRMHTENLACRIWTLLKEAHVGNAQVQARMYATYRREYENFTHLRSESIDCNTLTIPSLN